MPGAGIRREVVTLVLVAVLVPALAGAAALARVEGQLARADEALAAQASEDAQDQADARIAGALAATAAAAHLPPPAAVEAAGGPAWWMTGGAVMARSVAAADRADPPADVAAGDRAVLVAGEGPDFDGVYVVADGAGGTLVRFVPAAELLAGAPEGTRLLGGGAGAPLASGEGSVAVPSTRTATGAWRAAAVGLLAFTTLGGAVVAMVLTQRVVAPLRDLTEAARAQAAGDRHRRARVGGSRETARLAEAFNAMAADLARHEAGLVARAERSEADVEDLEFAALHDLREPIRSVATLAAQVLEEQGARLDEDGRRALELCRDTARHVEGVAADVARVVDASRRELRLAPVRISEALAEAAGGDARVRLAGDAEAVADRGALVEILRELVGNGLKFTKRADPRVTVEARRAGTTVEVEVADDGIGIPARHREDVTQPFRRLHPRAFPGTGVGLAVVRRLVERHGGRLGIGEAPGGGTRVRFTLPEGGPSSTLRPSQHEG